MVNFLFALTVFRYLVVMRRVQLGCFYCLHSSPSTILGIRTLETLGYPTVKTAFFCVPSFWHNTGVWRTDSQTGW